MSSDRSRVLARETGAEDDLDCLPTTREEAKRIRKLAEAAPHIAAAYRKSAGRPPTGDTPKTAISIRLDSAALAAFKASGPGWQTRINDAVVKAASKLKPAKGKFAR